MAPNSSENLKVERMYEVKIKSIDTKAMTTEPSEAPRATGRNLWHNRP